MGRKRRPNKQGSVLTYRNLPAEELYRRIDAARARQDVRAAIDMAKECYRRAADPRHVELLGSLYVLRARELADKDLHLEAFSVLNHALRLGYGSQELLHLAFECGLRGGQPGPALAMYARVQEPVLRARAARFLADEAVMQGDGISRLCEPRIREEASRIRLAFEAFERGDDQTAASELKPIGLRSLCAGWKWVVLGLLAHARADQVNARLCWNRAGNEGQAGRLANLLRSSLFEEETTGGGPAFAACTKLLAHLGSPRSVMLERIRTALAEGSGIAALNVSEQLLSTINPEEREAYARRLGRAVTSSLDWKPAVFRRFRQVFGGFPEDPMLARVTAFHIERESPEDALQFWQDYLNDLRHVKVIPFRLWGRTRALIWQRMGDIARRIERMEMSVAPFGRFRDLRPAHSPTAARCYRTSIKHHPEDLETHEKLLEVLIQDANRKAIEDQAEEILKRWPSHVDSLLLLGENCFHRQAFRKALKYFDRAREAEPFNTKTDCKVQACLLRSADRRLGQGNLDLARKDYEQAAALCRPSEPSSSLVYCQWAALEWRAGNPADAERLYAQAASGTEHPLVLHYQMAVELRKAQAPPREQARFNNLVEAAWKREPSGAEAAGIAEAVRQYEESPVRLEEYEDLERSLGRYFQRACKKAPFTEEQLLRVCRCLDAAQAWELLERFGCRGTKEFRSNYFFPMFVGRAQLQQGSRPLPRKTIRMLNRARLQATQAGEHEVAGDIAMIITSGARHTGRSVYRLLEQILAGAADGEIPDFEDDPFDDLEDSEDDVPQRRGRSCRRDLDRDQMRLFDDIVSPEAERP